MIDNKKKMLLNDETLFSNHLVDHDIASYIVEAHLLHKAFFRAHHNQAMEAPLVLVFLLQ